jgi:hypothetical protein
LIGVSPYSRTHGTFPFQNCVRQGDVITIVFFSLAVKFTVRKAQYIRKERNARGYCNFWIVVVVLLIHLAREIRPHIK